MDYRDKPPSTETGSTFNRRHRAKRVRINQRPVTRARRRLYVIGDWTAWMREPRVRVAMGGLERFRSSADEVRDRLKRDPARPIHFSGDMISLTQPSNPIGLRVKP
jgi:hypothetical protein